MKRAALRILTPLLLAALLLPGRAWAHAHLIRADLAPDSHLKVSVGTARFWFDEPLNPALSRVVILDAQGRQVNADAGALNPANDEELDVTVPTLPDGVYSVRWTSDSAQDGHVMHGFYLFTVGGPGAVAPGNVPAAITGTSGASLDDAAIAVALAHWLVLIASALWTGALALEILVLVPGCGRAPEATRLLALYASARIGPLVQVGLLASLLASALELASQTFAAAGDWSGLTSTSVVGDILGTQYGTWLIARALLASLALLVVGIPLPGVVLQPLAGGHRTRRAARPLHRLIGRLLAGLGLAYLLALALSGHAASVPHLVIASVSLDWLHLIAMAIWIGGIAAIALVLLPLLPAATPDRRAMFLDLLDRFSPAAYLALVAAALTGMFNAQVRIESWSTLTGTSYGRLLLIKLALIGLIMALSASHVLRTRPRLRAMLETPGTVGLGRGFASLALRLRLEALLGGGVLLCVALMGQVAPGASAFDATVVQVVNQQSTISAGPISSSSSLGALAVALTVNPPDVGQAQFTVSVEERGTSVADGQVRIKLSLLTDPALGAAFVETTPSTGGYSGFGDLVQEGLWRADVLVRTRSDPQEFRDVPFVFVANPEAFFLRAPLTDGRYGSAAVRFAGTPGAPGTLSVQLRPGLRVRYAITMPDMNPQGGDVRQAAGGWYHAEIVAPMAGFMNLALQVQEGSSWRTARMLVCEVDNAYAMHLLD